ncbi:MAG: hydroxyacylglutathione hydrolase, partial [Synechococcus sp.]|nr:hydroxyacylglutathione hydrolase [Synechococcus sp.]
MALKSRPAAAKRATESFSRAPLGRATVSMLFALQRWTLTSSLHTGERSLVCVEIQRLPVLRDNYVFVLVDPDAAAAAVVDPAVAEPVIAALEAQQLRLSVVL